MSSSLITLLMSVVMAFMLGMPVCQEAAAAPSGDRAATPKPVRDKSLPYEALRKQIAKRWKPKAGANKRVIIALRVNDSNRKSVYVHNSSLDSKFDDQAKNAVLAVIPVKVAGVKDGVELRARFDPFVKSVDVYEAEDVDFGPYMALMQRTVKRNWFPPKNKTSKHTVLVWKVLSDGTIKDTRIETSSGDERVDKAALLAIEKTGKLRPLPSGSPDSVDIQFTFDYNVRGGRGTDSKSYSSSEADKSDSSSSGAVNDFVQSVDKFLRPR